MLWFFRIFVWAIFIGLVSYVFVFWKYEEKVNDKLPAIRKIWYLLFILGSLVFWSFEPASIFTHWVHYFIVAVFFTMVDGFVFLSLYLRKFGGGELEAATQKTVERSHELIKDHIDKIKNVLFVLNRSDQFEKSSTHSQYLSGLQSVLQAYAEQEKLTIELFPFSSREDRKQLLAGVKNHQLLRSKLHRAEIYYHEEDHAAYYPIGILTGKYVVKITSSSYVSEVDCALIGILLASYDWAMQNGIGKAVENGGLGSDRGG
ncbi:type II toxin-antitoxin system SpoIISA family toxin [Jeotgalibacillus soli]|uniref:Stage II sporulation protein SA n=1 Tax=Jeotgalibacillus soli TaxID=889306 RepID=A0A0C2RUD9_9BACL|nr:type II toxin-antitoxin system SpoIISA family toxin [Jeotgalibacillus soli]KIL45359.1 hypothetical protein KP78_29030 [Jeotgalibacillus soli]